MRNKKVAILSCIVLVCILLTALFYFIQKDTNIALQPIRETIHINGLSKEYRIIFIADTHLSLCDERDSLLLDKSARRRNQMYAEAGFYPEEALDSLFLYVKEQKPDLLILGGDILDSAMYASIDYLKAGLEKMNIPYIYSLGNHDFEYGYEYFSDIAYNMYLPRLTQLSTSANGFQIIETDDFNILAVNDDCSQIPPAALEALRDLKKRHKPIITITHVPIQPLEDDTLLELTKQIWGISESGNSKVLMGFDSVTPNETTVAFINEVCADDSPVVLNLSGHIHFYHKDILGPNTTQIVTGAGYKGSLIEITLTP